MGDLGEETGLLGASFMDSRVPASARKKFFNNPRNLQAYSFKPGTERETTPENCRKHDRMECSVSLSFL